MSVPVRVRIQKEHDVAVARQAGKKLAQEMGFREADQARVVTSISELAGNIFYHAGGGHLIISPVAQADREGLEIVAVDTGPGIENVELALRDGYSTSRGLGAGLPGVRRLMDKFEIESEKGKGTTVVARIWLR